MSFRPPFTSVAFVLLMIATSLPLGASFQNFQVSRGSHFALRMTFTAEEATEKWIPVKKKKKLSKRDRVMKMFRRAKSMERKGQWKEAAHTLRHILEHVDSNDAHTHLAWARLEARRAPKSPDRAKTAFEQGTTACPSSVHLWQAWAKHEESLGNHQRAEALYQQALVLDPKNPYVCHAYGRMLERQGSIEKAYELWKEALTESSTAALVCSLGASLVANKQWKEAQTLYHEHTSRVRPGRERTEVVLAAAWLEENHLHNRRRAEELIQSCIEDPNMDSTLAQVAIARLEGRMRSGTPAEKLEQACLDLERGEGGNRPADGRIYNAWAATQVKAKRYRSARKILRRGLEQFPNDHSLMQAAGKAEERLGNYTGARQLYGSSLCIRPAAPCLVSLALLEMKSPQSGSANVTEVKQLFEEALLLDNRHAAAYNAYGRIVFENEGGYNASKAIFERGIAANCQDAASIYHGYAQLELAMKNATHARDLLMKGRDEVNRQSIGNDSPHRDRGVFVCHTLGMLELNSNRATEALHIFEDAMEKYGRSSLLLLGCALCEVKLGNTEEARTLFERAIDHDDNHAQAWQAWGIMEMRAGDYDTAKALFECGIRKCPRHGALWHSYAVMEGRMGHASDARLLFARGLKQVADYVPFYQGWSSMELREGNTNAAKALITRALTVDKTKGLSWLIASDIESKLGNRGLATLFLRRGIECAPNEAVLYKALGDIVLACGKINEARIIYEKGIEIDPMFAALYHALAELEARIGNFGGLAELHKRTSAVFSANGTQGSNGLNEKWNTRIKSSRGNGVSRTVAALAERIVDEDENKSVSKKSVSLVDGLDEVFESGLVGALLSVDYRDEPSS